MVVSLLARNQVINNILKEIADELEVVPEDEHDLTFDFKEQVIIEGNLLDWLYISNLMEAPLPIRVGKCFYHLA